MLYLDTSALIKCYFKEKGSDAVIARAARPDEEVFTSMLSFAEVHSAMARKHREKKLDSRELTTLREAFQRDWSILLNVIELDLRTMAALPKLLEQYPLKAGDAIQLSTAIWLNKTIRSEVSPPTSGVLEFGVADRTLAIIADRCGLRVFNPEDQN